MRINKKNAFMLWEQFYGNAEFACDFHGNLMCKRGYGNRKYYILDGEKRYYCGWNVHHILPKVKGGTSTQSNLLCTNIATNEAASDKITFWIDDCLYQVQCAECGYEIVRLN